MRGFFFFKDLKYRSTLNFYDFRDEHLKGEVKKKFKGFWYLISGCRMFKDNPLKLLIEDVKI